MADDFWASYFGGLLQSPVNGLGDQSVAQPAVPYATQQDWDSYFKDQVAKEREAAVSYGAQQWQGIQAQGAPDSTLGAVGSALGETWLNIGQGLVQPGSQMVRGADLAAQYAGEGISGLFGDTGIGQAGQGIADFYGAAAQQQENFQRDYLTPQPIGGAGQVSRDIGMGAVGMAPMIGEAAMAGPGAPALFGITAGAEEAHAAEKAGASPEAALGSGAVAGVANALLFGEQVARPLAEALAAPTEQQLLSAGKALKEVWKQAGHAGLVMAASDLATKAGQELFYSGRYDGTPEEMWSHAMEDAKSLAKTFVTGLFSTLAPAAGGVRGGQKAAEARAAEPVKVAGGGVIDLAPAGPGVEIPAEVAPEAPTVPSEATTRTVAPPPEGAPVEIPEGVPPLQKVRYPEQATVEPTPAPEPPKAAEAPAPPPPEIVAPEKVLTAQPGSAPVEPPAPKKKMAGFEAEKDRLAKRKAFLLAETAGDGGAVFSSENGNKSIVSEDPRPDGAGWRMTRLDPSGEPTGHFEFKTRDEAILAHTSSYWKIESSAPTRPASAKESSPPPSVTERATGGSVGVVPPPEIDYGGDTADIRQKKEREGNVRVRKAPPTIDQAAIVKQEKVLETRRAAVKNADQELEAMQSQHKLKEDNIFKALTAAKNNIKNPNRAKRIQALDAQLSNARQKAAKEVEAFKEEKLGPLVREVGYAERAMSRLQRGEPHGEAAEKANRSEAAQRGYQTKMNNRETAYYQPEIDAEEAGAKAHAAGDVPFDNPHEPGDLHDAWQRGWDGAQEESKSAALGSPASAQAQQQIPVSLGGKPSGKPIGTAEVMGELSRIWDVPIRFKRFRQKALGIFKTLPEVIRTKGAGDIATATHEIAHAVSRREGKNFWKASGGPAMRELYALGKALYGNKKPTAGYFEEGFAEYMRHYLTRDDAATVAPEFHKYFTAKVGADPKIGGLVGQSKDVISRWRDQSPTARAEGQIDFDRQLGKQPIRERAEKAIDTFKAHWIDRWHPVEKAVEQLLAVEGKTTKDLPAKQNPARILAALDSSASSRAAKFIKEGPINAQGDKIGPSMKEALAPVKAEDYRRFFAYTLAKSTIEDAALPTPIETGLSVADAKAVVRDNETPEWEKAARDLNAYGNALVDVLVESGALTPKAGDAIKASREFYIPLLRVYLESAAGEETSVYQGKGGTGGGAAIKRRTGSERAIKDPFESFGTETERILKVALRAQTARALVNLAGKTRGGGEIIERVPSDVTSIKVKQIADQLKKLGIDVPKGVAADEMARVFIADSHPHGSDPIVTLVVNGERQFWHVKDPLLYEALLGSSPEQIGLLEHFGVGTAMRATARGVRLGATGLRASFGFITNPIRDTWTGAIQTSSGSLKYLASALRSLGPERATDRTFYEMGGEMSGPLGGDIKVFKKLRREVLARTNWDKALTHMLHPIDTLRDAISSMETLGRRGEFANVYEKTMKETNGDREEATLRATEAASEATINFRRAGIYARALNSYVPFFNAAIQGPNAMIRSFKARPVATTMRALVGLTLPSLALYALHKDEKWYQELPLWEKSIFVHFKVGDKIIRLPLPFEFGMFFGTLPVATLEYMRKSDPKRYREMVEQAAGVLAPDVSPTLPKLAVELIANKSFFTGRPIESERFKGRLPEDRFYENTSEVYKSIGKVFGISPLRVQHIAEGLTGGLSRDITEPIKKQREAADLPVIGTLFSRKEREGQSVRDLYRDLDKAEEVYSSLRDAAKRGDGARVMELRQKYGPLLARLPQLRAASARMKDMRGKQAAEQITNIARIALGREANP